MTQSDSQAAPFPDPLRDTLEAFQEECRELSETWRHLDGKAQGAVATAGIFLAASFAFVRSFTEGQLPSGSSHALVITSVLLVLSMVLAVLALRIREVVVAPFGDRLEELTNDLMRIADDQEGLARAPDFLREQIDMWRTVNAETSAANAKKATFVLASQVSLLFAVFAIAGLTVAIIVGWI